MKLTPYKLGEFCRMKYGKMPPKDMLTDKGFPIFSGYRITGYAKEYLYDDPRVIVVARGVGGTGDVKMSPEKSWITNLSIILDHDSRIVDKKFLLYRLGLEPLKDKLNTGAAQAQITIGSLKPYVLPLPELVAQQRIASILSAYDDLIENNRRRIQLLEQAARLLYKEWFVYLRFPGHEHVTITDGIPEGWEMMTFGEVVENFDRFRIPLSVLEREKRPGPYPYYGAAGVLSHIDGYLFSGRFLLIGEDGTVATPSGSAMLQFVEGEFWVSNHAHVVQGSLVTTEFLYCFMSHYQIRPHITGVAQPKLSQRNLNRIEVLVPSGEIQSFFQDMIEPLNQQVFTLRSQIEELAKARDLLLPRLMNGEVVV